MSEHWLKDDNFDGDGWRARFETMSLGQYGPLNVLTIWVRENCQLSLRNHGRFAVLGFGEFSGMYLEPEQLEALRQLFAALPAPELAQ